MYLYIFYTDYIWTHTMKLNDAILANAADIAAIRRDIHAHPELSYHEDRTSDVVAAKLAQWGIAVHRGLGKTGVVGTIVGSLPIKTGNVKGKANANAIGLRADMDALPMQEVNQFPHASVHAGKMHACGHDGHTAMLLGAAQHLAKNRDFAGTVHLIFQPAEEGGAGAKAMMDDGLFTLFPMDAVFGLHNWPGAPVGQFGMVAGPMMASSNEFEIVLKGKGAHAALPHEGADPIMAAVNLAQALQTIITRNKKPIDSAVLSITQIHAGDAYNVIPNQSVLRGTIRTFTVPVLDLIEQRLREITAGVAQAFGMTVELSFKRNYPPLINSVPEAEFCRDVASSVVGADNVVWNAEPTMGAEDFAFMLLEKPGCYVFAGNGLGAAGAKGSDHRMMGHGPGPCMLHNPSYDFNDQLIPVGVSYWAALVQQWFERKQT
jgi:amidohydrolase